MKRDLGSDWVWHWNTEDSEKQGRCKTEFCISFRSVTWIHAPLPQSVSQQGQARVPNLEKNLDVGDFFQFTVCGNDSCISGFPHCSHRNKPTQVIYGMHWIFINMLKKLHTPHAVIRENWCSWDAFVTTCLAQDRRQGGHILKGE